MAERRALNSLDRELEKRNNSDMIAELNSCLGVSQVSKSKRPRRNSPTTDVTTETVTAMLNKDISFNTKRHSANKRGVPPALEVP